MEPSLKDIKGSGKTAMAFGRQFDLEKWASFVCLKYILGVQHFAENSLIKC